MMHSNHLWSAQAIHLNNAPGTPTYKLTSHPLSRFWSTQGPGVHFRNIGVDDLKFNSF
jgi:hypothetical protein